MALHGPRIAGFLHAGLTGTPPPIVDRSILAVSDIAVTAGHRRRAIGRALIAAAERWGREQGAVELRPTVVARNVGALAFHEAPGLEMLPHGLRRVPGR